MSTLQISNLEDRDDLYYGQYLYQARFFLREAGCLRKLDHDSIDQALAWRSRWNLTGENLAGITTNLHTVCDQLTDLKDPYKKVIYQNWVYVYTSSFADIAKLTLGPLVFRGATRANITHPKNTVGLKNPKHKFRTYVRGHKPTQSQIDSLKAFVDAAGDDIRPSPSLRTFLIKQRYLWMQEHFFVDHNEMSIATALALINPKLIRKTMPIVQINN